MGNKKIPVNEKFPFDEKFPFNEKFPFDEKIINKICKLNQKCSNHFSKNLRILNVKSTEI